VINMPSPFTDGATILPIDAIQEFNLMENPKRSMLESRRRGERGNQIGPTSFNGAASAILRLWDFHEVEFLDGVDRQDRRSVGERTRHIDHRAGVEEIHIDDASTNQTTRPGDAVGALGPRGPPTPAEA